MTVMDAVTLSVALLGATLGLINTYVILAERRVRLRVVPMGLLPQDQDTPSLGVEVVNLSSFPVVIASCRFQSGRFWVKDFYYQKGIRTIDGEEFPVRIEPRNSIVLQSDYASLRKSPDASKLKYVAVRTVCGKKVLASCRAMIMNLEKSHAGHKRAFER